MFGEKAGIKLYNFLSDCNTVCIPSPTDLVQLVNNNNQYCKCLAGNFMKGTVNIYVKASDFTGNNVMIAQTIGKTPAYDFTVYVNAGLGISGNGTLINENDGFTFNSVTGIFTMPPDNYLIQIYNTI